MPIHQVDGKWQWGSHGTKYSSRAGAERQAAAAHANGFKGDSKVAKDMDPAEWSAFKRLMMKFFSEEEKEPEHQANDEAPNAAGMAIKAPSGKLLFLKRSDEGDHANEWCFPGGCAKEGETPEQTARRETKEETGYASDGELKPFHANGNFATFYHEAPEEFAPKLNEEHTEHVWADPKDPPKPLHPGVAQSLGMEVGEDANIDPNEANATEGKPKLDLIMPNVTQKLAPTTGAHDSIAMDRSSARSYDRDGRLHVAKNHISKATVNEYYGREIPNCEELGLKADKKYRLLRDPEELKKAAATFNNLPLLSRHIPITADSHPQDLTIGSLGTDAEYNHPYLDNSIVIWPQNAIDAVESEQQKELSSAYRYRADMTPGTYEGQDYDGVMRDIVGNHVALVREGRAGSDVVVGDSALPQPTYEVFDMAKVLSRHAAVAQGALIALLRPKLAMDVKTLDLSSVLEKVTGKNFKEQKSAIVAGITGLTKGKLAQDANLNDMGMMLDALADMDVAEGADMDPNSGLPMGAEELKKKAMDDQEAGGVHDKIMAMLTGKVPPELMVEISKLMKGEATAGMDEPPEFPGKPEVGKGPEMITKPAMDAAIAEAVANATKDTQAKMKAVREAEIACEPYVGKLAIACDSAADVYRTTLGALGVKTEGVHPDALPAILATQPKRGERKASKSETVAMDAAVVQSFTDAFPAAGKIGNV